MPNESISKADVAYLVLSYLREEGFNSTASSFEKECANLLATFDTSMQMKNLHELIKEYIMLKLEHQKRDQFAKSFQGSTQHRNYMESLLGAMYSLLDTYNTFVNNTVQAQQHNGPLPPPPTFFSNLANTSAAVNAPQPVIKKQPATMPPVNFPSAFPAAPTLPLNPNIPKKPAPAVVSPNPNVPVPPAPATTLAQPPKAKNSKKPPQQRPIYTAPHSKLAPKPLGSEPQPSVVPAPQAPQAPVQQGNGTTMNNTSTAAPTNTTSSNNTTTAPVPMNSNSKPIQLNPLTGQVKSGSGNGGITVTPKQKKLPSPNELSLPNICKKENTPPNVNGDQHHQQHHKKHHDAPVHFNTPPRESSRHPRSDESQFLFSPAVAEDYDLGLGSTPFKPNVHLQLHSSDEPIPHSHVSFSIDSDTRIPSVSLIELPSDEFRKRQASEIFISPDQVRSSKRQRSNDSTVLHIKEHAKDVCVNLEDSFSNAEYLQPSSPTKQAAVPSSMDVDDFLSKIKYQ